MNLTPEAVVMSTLRRALSARRPYGSREEGALLASLVPADLPSWIDAAGNLHVDLRGDRRHRTLFVAHVDTVHRTGGVNRFDDSTPIWRARRAPLVPKRSKTGKPVVDAKGQPVFERPWSTRDHALGADDGAGVALLAGLIAARVPAYYVFTRGEEVGGIGARHLADEHADLLVQFDRAIAFDRKSTWSVITHQGTGRCCSDAFAEALSSELNLRNMLYMPDDTGVYTDTAEWIDLIPECTNVSAGYENEHGDRESLDTAHLMALFEAVRTVDWDALPTERDPFAEPEPEPQELAWQSVLHLGASGATDDDIDPMDDPFYFDDNPGDLRRMKERMQ